MKFLNSKTTLAVKRFADAAVDTLVVGVGPNRILASLDRLTAPENLDTSNSIGSTTKPAQLSL